MIGHPGPYLNDDGDVWVPRTVPYLEARRLAKTGYFEYGDRLVYIGKSGARLLGFSRACRCDEVCELVEQCAACEHGHRDLTNGCWVENCACPTFDSGNRDACEVPAWHFRVEDPT